jgi:hypothetical protein
MSRRGLDNTPLPKRRYRIGGSYKPLLTKEIGFESAKKARREDKLRAAGMRKAIRDHPDHLDIDAARCLASALESEAGKPPARSLASARYMRLLRRRVAGQLWRLAKKTNGRVARIDLLPDGHRIPVADLHLLDPRKLLASLRTALNRLGAKEAGGWLYGFLHGEFDPLAEQWDIHFHLIAAGDMIDVAERLAGTRKYKVPLRRPNSKKALPRVKVSRKPLVNLPKPFLYCVQGYWPMRNFVDPENGLPARGPRSRIPEPHHTNLLLWFDRWKLADLTLLMKLKVTRSGFKVGKA